MERCQCGVVPESHGRIKWVREGGMVLRNRIRNSIFHYELGLQFILNLTG